jgi:hypothetical protein
MSYPVPIGASGSPDPSHPLRACTCPCKSPLPARQPTGPRRPPPWASRPVSRDASGPLAAAPSRPGAEPSPGARRATLTLLTGPLGQQQGSSPARGRRGGRRARQRAKQLVQRGPQGLCASGEPASVGRRHGRAERNGAAGRAPQGKAGPASPGRGESRVGACWCGLLRESNGKGVAVVAGWEEGHRLEGALRCRWVIDQEGASAVPIRCKQGAAAHRGEQTELWGQRSGEEVAVQEAAAPRRRLNPAARARAWQKQPPVNPGQTPVNSLEGTRLSRGLSEPAAPHDAAPLPPPPGAGLSQVAYAKHVVTVAGASSHGTVSP